MIQGIFIGLGIGVLLTLGIVWFFVFRKPDRGEK